jgi:hypothetical protein
MTAPGRVLVRCACGYAWESTSRSGRTTCPECDTRIYIPKAVRDRAINRTQTANRTDFQPR